MVTIPAPSPAALVDHPHCERSFPGDISPARHLVTVAYEIVQRDAVAARGLHACNIRDDDLPVAEKQLKLRGQFIPFGLAGQYRLTRAIQAQDVRRAIKSAEHKCDTLVLQ